MISPQVADFRCPLIDFGATIRRFRETDSFFVEGEPAKILGESGATWHQVYLRICGQCMAHDATCGSLPTGGSGDKWTNGITIPKDRRQLEDSAYGL